MDNKPAGREIQVYQPQPLAVIPIDASVPLVRTQRLRGFGVWARRWLRTSKPTEWITSTAQMLAVITAITTGIIYLRSGSFTAKQDAINATNERLKAEGIRLEARNDKLKDDQGRLEEKKAILIAETKAAKAEATLARAGALSAKREAEDYHAELVELATSFDTIAGSVKVLTEEELAKLAATDKHSLHYASNEAVQITLALGKLVADKYSRRLAAHEGSRLDLEDGLRRAKLLLIVHGHGSNREQR